MNDNAGELPTNGAELPLILPASQTSTMTYKPMRLLDPEEGLKIPTVDVNLKPNRITTPNPMIMPITFSATPTTIIDVTPMKREKRAVDDGQTPIPHREHKTTAATSQSSEGLETVTYTSKRSTEETSTKGTSDAILRATTASQIEPENGTIQSNYSGKTQKITAYLPVDVENQQQGQNVPMLALDQDFSKTLDSYPSLDKNMKLMNTDNLQLNPDVGKSLLTQGWTIMFLILAGLLFSICISVCIVAFIIWHHHPIKRRSRIHEMDAQLDKPIIINNLIPITKSNIKEHFIPSPTKKIY
ncbi:unnamed protein product [Didymodactylos carnosus]|uniref:Uncharacterized protein n=2 Tax=Didymodactylos carnosus TaxID=1234261 RepID=A0A8S2FBT7_9BILA|nr:unnamed protein product [Didymodactylos carnosus]CAF4218725.1 unnamed protein product [Didymodactylos carnosus]